MSRSNKKLIYIHRSQFNKYLYNKKKKYLNKNCYKFMLNSKIYVLPFFFFWKRNSILNRNLINKRICIHNGLIFHNINIINECEGFKLGEFSVSRKRPIHKGKQKQIKKIKIKKK